MGLDSSASSLRNISRFRRLRRARLVCVLSALCLAIPPLTAQVIEGAVTNASNGAPLAGVQVALLQDTATISLNVTGEDGKFRFAIPSEGDYILTFKKTGFSDGRRELYNVGVPGSTIPSDTALQPAATISGRVLDENGDPVPKAAVAFAFNALTANVFLGERPVLLNGRRQAATTDERGAFVIESSPGDYLLCAQPPAGFKPPVREAGARFEWARTCYPSQTTAESATVIRARQGSVLTGYDIRLRAAPLYRVSGVLLDEQGTPLSKGQLEARSNTGLLRAVSGDDGAFEFPAVQEGEWGIVAAVRTGDAAAPALGAFVTVRVADRDLTGVRLRLEAPFAIQGRMLVETPAGLEPVAGNAAVMAVNAPGIVSYSSSATHSDQNGAFALKPLVSGTFRFTGGATAPDRYYLDSILLGNQEVLGKDVELAGGSPPVTYIFRAHGGSIRASLADCEKARILATPKGTEVVQSLFRKQADATADSPAIIENMRPGEYMVLALQEQSLAALTMARFQPSHELIDLATTARVEPGINVNLRLRCIP